MAVRIRSCRSCRRPDSRPIFSSASLPQTMCHVRWASGRNRRRAWSTRSDINRAVGRLKNKCVVIVDVVNAEFSDRLASTPLSSCPCRAYASRWTSTSGLKPRKGIRPLPDLDQIYSRQRLVHLLPSLRRGNGRWRSRLQATHRAYIYKRSGHPRASPSLSVQMAGGRHKLDSTPAVERSAQSVTDGAMVQLWLHP